MSSPNDNTSPYARAHYDNPAAHRRQLSSGPLGGKILQTYTEIQMNTPHHIRQFMIVLTISLVLPTMLLIAQGNRDIVYLKNDTQNPDFRRQHICL
jgi:hypothetical protein